MSADMSYKPRKVVVLVYKVASMVEVFRNVQGTIQDFAYALACLQRGS